jgi:thiamine pyrophosphate-dependent acetolactate synthase large subunit-like protein
MYLHEAVASIVRGHGVDTIFGLIGDGNLYFVDSFIRRQGGRYIPVAHEASAVQAAAGYSRTTSRTGVATVTHGPALTNTLTPLVEAVRANTPLVLIAGDTAVVDKNNLQSVEQRPVILSTGAAFEQVRSPETIAEDVAWAFRRAELTRGPVVLNVPVDFQWMEVKDGSAAPIPVVRQAVAASDNALDAALGIIASARRPIVLTGRGGTSPTARAAALGLARRIGAPVATTLQARELFRGEPEDLGIFGTLSTPKAVQAIGQADCVISLGAALNQWTTAEQGLLSGKRTVHVDIDAGALNRHVLVDAPVNGDLTTVCDQFVSALDAAGIRATGFAAHVIKMPDELPAKVADVSAGTVDVADALRRVDARFTEDRSLVIDGGRYFHHAAYNVRTGRPGSYVHTLEYGSIGLGMASAIGAAAAQPDTPVLLICGDGGFMLGGLAEFNTAVRCGLDIVVVVMNDGAYGAEHIQFRNKGMDPALSTFDWPDFAAVARSLGGDGYSVREIADLESALDAIAARARPVLIDVHLDPDYVPSPYN